MAKSLETLKTEAASLGMEIPEGIRATELQQLVDAKYDEMEAADAAEVVVPVATDTIKVAPVTGKKTIGMKAREAEEAARKTRVITVFDNDSRENGETTVAPVTCANQYFDLGSVYVPLGEKVEVMQGHIDVLKDVDIPHHMRVGDSTKTVLRKRYTISYEDVK